MKQKKCGNCKALVAGFNNSSFDRCEIYGNLESITGKKVLTVQLYDPLRHKDCTGQCRTNIEIVNRQREIYESKHHDETYSE